MVTLSDFLSDQQDKRFKDVIEDKRLNFQDVINFFNREDIRKRMEESEANHKRPALAGVIIELENLEVIEKFFTNNDAHSTVRFRQAVGVLVKLHMIELGWKTTGVKGALGTRDPNIKYENTKGSLSRWFVKTEHYIKRSI
jgi:hypothetical protein